MANVSTDLPGSAWHERGAARGGLAGEEAANTVIGLAIAVLIVAMPIFAHGVSPLVGIGLAVALATACAWKTPHISVVAVICAFLFQNLFVALASDFVRSDDDFDVIRAYNFLILAVTWVVMA